MVNPSSFITAFRMNSCSLQKIRNKIQQENVKSEGSREGKQICRLNDLCCYPHVPIVFCTHFCKWDESTINLFIKIHQYLCNITRYECFSFLYPYKIKIHASSTFHYTFEVLYDNTTLQGRTRPKEARDNNYPVAINMKTCKEIEIN